MIDPLPEVAIYSCACGLQTIAFGSDKRRYYESKADQGAPPFLNIFKDFFFENYDCIPLINFTVINTNDYNMYFILYSQYKSIGNV